MLFSTGKAGALSNPPSGLTESIDELLQTGDTEIALYTFIRDDRPWRLATGSCPQFSAAKHKEFAGNVDSTPPPAPRMVMHC